MTGLFDFGCKAACTERLAAVVHIKLNRMSGVLNTVDFFHLQIDIGIDHIVSEYTANCQELTVCVKRIQCFTQATSNLRYSSGLFSRQIVKIFVCCVAWVDFVFNTVPNQPLA